MTTLGLDFKQMHVFFEYMVIANNEQLNAMQRHIQAELQKEAKMHNPLNPTSFKQFSNSDLEDRGGRRQIPNSAPLNFIEEFKKLEEKIEFMKQRREENLKNFMVAFKTFINTDEKMEEEIKILQIKHRKLAIDQLIPERQDE